MSATRTIGLFVLLLLFAAFVFVQQPVARTKKFVINTWPFTSATRAAWNALQTSNAMDAIEIGAHVCELEQCDHSVGFGGSPNEKSETTLDAMIMNGKTREVGAVANLKRVKEAIKVGKLELYINLQARQVLEKTFHTLLVGEDATDFAIRMGFQTTNLSTPYSMDLWKKWIADGEKPNFWKPKTRDLDHKWTGHDTLSMVVRDDNGDLACATTTNGLTYRIPGRVGDGPIPGASCYVENGVGGASGTGIGDLALRFLPAYRAVVVNMKYRNMHPREACQEALDEILKYEPKAYLGLVCFNDKGEYGAAAIGDFKNFFKYSVRDDTMQDVVVKEWNQTEKD